MTHLTLLELNPRTRACRRDISDPQAMHRTIMGLFPGTDDPSPRRHWAVLWRVEPADAPTLLIQSAIAPDLHALPADYGSARTKPIDGHLDRLMSGMLVSYRAVVNPVRTTRRTHHPDASPGQAVIPAGERAAWWQRRALGAGLGLTDPATITGRPDQRVRRGERRLPLYTARIDGTAIIQDPHLLREAITSGIGRAKAWGCGLLTVSPIT